MKPPSPALVRRGLYIMVSVFLCAMATITGVAIYGSYTKAVTTAERQGISYALALAEHASRTFGEAERALDDVLEDAAPGGDLSSVSEPSLHAIFAAHVRHTPQIGSLFAVDPAGRLIVDSAVYPARHLDVSGSDQFRFHRGNPSREPFVSLPYRNGPDGAWCFAITRRLSHRDGSFAGYVGVALREKYFDSFYSTLTPVPTQRIALLRTDGSYIAVAPFNQSAMGSNIGTQPLFASHLRTSPSGAFRDRRGGYDRTDRLVSYSRLSGYPVVAEVSSERQAVLAGWRHDSVLTATLAALFAAAVILLSFVLTRRLRLLEYAEAENYAVISTAMDGFWITDTQGRLLDVNSAFCAMTGYCREELLTMRITDIEAEERPEETAERIRKISSTGRDRFESKHRTREGRIIDVEVSVNYLPMAGGRFTVFVRDITGLNRIQAALKESEAKFHQLFEEAPDPILLVDESSRFIDCNQTAVRMLGVSTREEVLLRHPSSFSPPFQPDGEASSQKADAIIRQAFGAGENVHFEWLHQRPDGSPFIVEVSLKPIALHGKKVQLVHWHDITDRKQTENTLRRLYAAVEHSPAAILITDAKGTIEYANPKFYQLTEYTAAEVLGQNPSILKSGTQPREYYREMWETILSGREWQGEFHNRSKHGRLFWEKVSISPIRDSSGTITHFVAVKEDITEHKRLQEQLAQLAHFDTLTGLPNRALFFDLSAQAIALARRENRRCGILYIDLDGFKDINDTHGHAIGDEVLCGAAHRIRSCLRESDTVARMGGDEFTVILATLHHREDAAVVAQKIIAALSAPLLFGAVECRVGASIGISIFPDDADDVEKLLLGADRAMYEVKRTGKNHYRYYVGGECPGPGPTPP